MKMFDRQEMMPREELEQLQLERLQALLARLKRNVRRYREMLGDSRVESLADLGSLPTTSPEDVAESFPYGMFALPLREVIRLHSTMGPQGKPFVLGHTRNDLAHWGRLVARQLIAADVTANDILQLSLGGSVHWGAAGYQAGAEQIEASIIAEDPRHVDYQLALLENYRPTILVTTPANAVRLMGEMDRRRMDPQSLSLKTVLLTRPVADDTRSLLRAGLFANVKCNFGVGQILDPGLCVECEHGRFHANEDQFLFEVVEGELVITTLAREAMPLLRYRTRIAGEFQPGKCPCGRTGRVFLPGPRLDGRLLIDETPLYECQIAELLARQGLGEVPFHSRAADQHLELQVRINSEIFGDTVRANEQVRDAIQSEFNTRFGIEARVHFTTRSSA